MTRKRARPAGTDPPPGLSAEEWVRTQRLPIEAAAAFCAHWRGHRATADGWAARWAAWWAGREE